METNTDHRKRGLRFLDDRDLVEQERDQLDKVLFNSSDSTNIELPFSLEPYLLPDSEDIASDLASPVDSEVESSGGPTEHHLRLKHYHHHFANSAQTQIPSDRSPTAINNYSSRSTATPTHHDHQTPTAEDPVTDSDTMPRGQFYNKPIFVPPGATHGPGELDARFDPAGVPMGYRPPFNPYAAMQTHPGAAGAPQFFPIGPYQMIAPFFHAPPGGNAPGGDDGVPHGAATGHHPAYLQMLPVSPGGTFHPVAAAAAAHATGVVVSSVGSGGPSRSVHGSTSIAPTSQFFIPQVVSRPPMVSMASNGAGVPHAHAPSGPMLAAHAGVPYYHPAAGAIPGYPSACAPQYFTATYATPYMEHPPTVTSAKVPTSAGSSEHAFSVGVRPGLLPHAQQNGSTSNHGDQREENSRAAEAASVTSSEETMSADRRRDSERCESPVIVIDTEKINAAALRASSSAASSSSKQDSEPGDDLANNRLANRDVMSPRNDVGSLSPPTTDAANNSNVVVKNDLEPDRNDSVTASKNYENASAISARTIDDSGVDDLQVASELEENTPQNSSSVNNSLPVASNEFAQKPTTEQQSQDFTATAALEHQLEHSAISDDDSSNSPPPPAGTMIFTQSKKPMTDHSTSVVAVSTRPVNDASAPSHPPASYSSAANTNLPALSNTANTTTARASSATSGSKVTGPSPKSSQSSPDSAALKTMTSSAEDPPLQSPTAPAEHFPAIGKAASSTDASKLDSSASVDNQKTRPGVKSPEPGSDADLGVPTPPPEPPVKTWASLLKNTSTAKSAIVLSQADAMSDGELSRSGVALGPAAPKPPRAPAVGSVRGQYAGRDSAGNYARGTDSYSRGGSESARSRDASSTGSAEWRDDVELVEVARDAKARAIGEHLVNARLFHKGAPFVLRGLENRGNWCYANGAIQALLACPPFFHLLLSLTPLVKRPASSTPVTDAFCRLVNEFPYRGGPGSSRRRGELTHSFEPEYIYKAVKAIKADQTFKGHQEDAEEFLLAVLNSIHEEMVSCINLVKKQEVKKPEEVEEEPLSRISTGSEGGEWQQVGPGRKTAITRQAVLGDSPLADIFVGYQRFSMTAQGSKESVTLQPFFTLPLEIHHQEVRDIHSALRLLMHRESIKGFSSRNREVDATRRTSIDKLPVVLILQLKYFRFTEEGLVKKLIKPVEFKVDLQIDRDHFSPNLRQRVLSNQTRRDYKLFAVVFHHGEKAEGGHYTTIVFHGGGWVRLDDSYLESTNLDDLLSFKAPRVPYLLFYRRCDAL